MLDAMALKGRLVADRCLLRRGGFELRLPAIASRSGEAGGG
jgi:hypothetical protein